MLFVPSGLLVVLLRSCQHADTLQGQLCGLLSPCLVRFQPGLQHTPMHCAHRCAVATQSFPSEFPVWLSLPHPLGSLFLRQPLSFLSFLEASCASSLAFERGSFAFNKQRWLQAWADLRRAPRPASHPLDQRRRQSVPGRT